MSEWAFQLFDDDEHVTFDSRFTAGGVVAAVGVYAATDTGELRFAAFPGRSVQIVPVTFWALNSEFSVVADTALGFPRVTIGVAQATRRFMVLVY